MYQLEYYIGLLRPIITFIGHTNYQTYHIIYFNRKLSDKMHCILNSKCILIYLYLYPYTSNDKRSYLEIKTVHRVCM